MNHLTFSILQPTLSKLVMYIACLTLICSCTGHTDTKNIGNVALHSENTALFQGIYYQHSDRAFFRPCGQKSAIIAMDVTDSIEGKYIEVLSFRHENEPVYIEFEGHKNEKSDTVFMTGLTKISALSLDAGCYKPSYQCSGNEPNWLLSIYPELKLLIFRDYGSMESRLFDFQPPTFKNKNEIYTAKNENGDQIKVIVTEKNCSDGMSEMKYNFAAEVYFNQQKLRGCARKNKN